ncbi:MAG: recombination mediator RecR [Flavobacteriaceae bacterium]|nr:recombination mediator RecR [Flavobacteriaceae bacterium]
MEFSSKLLQSAVDDIAQLPGIGKRTALRLALHILKLPKSSTNQLANSLINFREKIKFCKSCNNLSDSIICDICSNDKRDKQILCVVQDIRDVIAVENTQQFKGYYHVLGGIISPIDGVGPQDLNVDSLIEKVKKEEIKEIIFALSSTMEAETTIFYLYKLLLKYKVVISVIAKGISVGDELEYTDEITLGRSIMKRVPYESSA